MEQIKIDDWKTVKANQAGVVLIDKPTGWTSHDVVGWVRRQVGVKRVGHAGTLDPLATGLLIVLVGRNFTRLQDQFMKQDKVYEVTAKFGITTDTYDSQGSVVATADWLVLKQLTAEKIEAALVQLRGSITQTVPVYSAVKQGGRKLYDRARQGEVVENLPMRSITVHEFSLLDFNLDLSAQTSEASFRCSVSSGTYIRSLIHDLGQMLEVGAYVTQLRRLSIGKFGVKQALQIEKKG